MTTEVHPLITLQGAGDWVTEFPSSIYLVSNYWLQHLSGYTAGIASISDPGLLQHSVSCSKQLTPAAYGASSDPELPLCTSSWLPPYIYCRCREGVKQNEICLRFENLLWCKKKQKTGLTSITCTDSIILSGVVELTMIVEGCTGPLAVSTGLWTVCRLSFSHLPPHQSRYVNCDNNKTVDPRHIKGVGTSILSWSNLRHFPRLYKSVERPIIESTPIRNPIGILPYPCRSTLHLHHFRSCASRQKQPSSFWVRQRSSRQSEWIPCQQD